MKWPVEQVDISKNTKFMCCDMFISVKINLKQWKEWTTYIGKAAEGIRAIPILVKEEISGKISGCWKLHMATQVTFDVCFAHSLLQAYSISSGLFEYCISNCPYFSSYHVLFLNKFNMSQYMNFVFFRLAHLFPLDRLVYSNSCNPWVLS